MPKLTNDDWVEIYYALDSKLHHLPPPLPMAGKGWDRAGVCKQVAEDRANTGKWAAHIKSIMKKIGLDGTNMYREAPNA